MSNHMPIPPISFRPTDEMRQRLERLADQEQRTLSNMVRLLLSEALRAREQKGEGK